MQVNYKTISAMEFDVLTGSYKQVDKQVEDTSGAFTENAFFELLMGLNDQQTKGGYEEGSAFDMNAPLKSTQPPENSANSGFDNAFARLNSSTLSESKLDDSLNSNLYSLRFRQDALRTMEAGQSSAEQLKSSLFSDLLAAL